MPSSHKNVIQTEVMSPSLYTSSKTLFQKLQLPERTIFVGREDTYNYGEVLIRRHYGLFPSAYKKKRIVLLKNGRLFIYSNKKYGINVNLIDMDRVKATYSEKPIFGRDEMMCKCVVTLKRGNTRLDICIKGARATVTQWRRGFVLANKGTPLGDVRQTDELVWSQISLDPDTSEDVLASITNHTLRANNSVASLSMLYKSHTLPNKKNYTEIVACLKSHTLGTTRSRAVSSLSFYSDTVASELALSKSEYTESVGCEMADSGFSSPEPEVEIQGKFPLKPSRLEGIPMLSASILNFDAAFPVTTDED